MNDDFEDGGIPFTSGDWVIDRNNPGQPGQYTGSSRKAGPHIMVRVTYPGGGSAYRPLACLEAMKQGPEGSIEDRLRAVGDTGTLARK